VHKWEIKRHALIPKSTGGKQRRSQRQTQFRTTEISKWRTPKQLKKWKLHLKSSLSPQLVGFKSQTIIMRSSDAA
jgi:hypothetical protein